MTLKDELKKIQAEEIENKKNNKQKEYELNQRSINSLTNELYFLIVNDLKRDAQANVEKKVLRTDLLFDNGFENRLQLEIKMLSQQVKHSMIAKKDDRYIKKFKISRDKFNRSPGSYSGHYYVQTIFTFSDIWKSALINLKKRLEDENVILKVYIDGQTFDFTDNFRVIINHNFTDIKSTLNDSYGLPRPSIEARIVAILNL